MQLSLNQLVPKPLREKIDTYTSGIWKQSLQFNKGEQVFIQAPSGTGKTTLMHILYGLRTDITGSVTWGDKLLKGDTIAALRANDISIVFQDMRLFPELTAWDNLEIKRSLTNTITAEQAAGWMERLGIAHKRDSLSRTLSYGEQQRVAIIRALLQPFQWLLMDEPFSHLDNANISKAATLINEVVTSNNAGLILADLEDNNYFNYTKKTTL